MADHEQLFESSEPPLLSALLQTIDEARVQLPDFQRGWVWDDDHIRALIASVSLSYPVGAVMFLQTGGEGARFVSRLVEGVDESRKTVAPESLILDGQQRMTSLYLAMKGKQPVKTTTARKQEVLRWYYLDMRKCLDPNEERMDVVVSIPGDRRVTSDFGRKVDLDLSTCEKEYGNAMFPLGALFDSSRYRAWRREFQEHHRSRDNQAMVDLFDDFEEEVVERFEKYRIPVIRILKHAPKEAVCQVFERVNTGGVSLTVFELMTAVFAGDGFRLRQDWENKQAELGELDLVEDMDAPAFLAAVTLLATYRRHQAQHGDPVSCKRKDILRLTLAEYQQHAPVVMAGLRKANEFLLGESIFESRNLPYATQLIPLSVICAVLGAKADHHDARAKMRRWFWCGVFGELYGGANESRFAMDAQDVVAWVETPEADPPRSVRDASFSPIRLLSMQSRLSAAYKGLVGLQIKAGCKDLYSGQQILVSTYASLSIDIHHLFPQKYCQDRFPQRLWNSSANKAPLSASANRAIGGSAPSVYLRSIESKTRIGPADLDAIAATHRLDPALLRQDRFEEFVRDRAGRLLLLIEQAMGKAVEGWDSDEVRDAFGGSLTRSP
jgi:hypothetical protein